MYLDEKVIKIKHLDNGALFMLYSILSNKDYKQSIKQLIDANILDKNLNLNEKVLPYLHDDKTKSKKKIDNTKFIDLAKKMIDLFPKGKKDGRYSWRDSAFNIAIRLQKLYEKASLPIDEELVLRATEKYVKHHEKENFAYMQLLKYFICKEKTVDNVKCFESTMFTWMDNIDDDSVNNDNWTNNLI